MFCRSAAISGETSARANSLEVALFSNVSAECGVSDTGSLEQKGAKLTKKTVLVLRQSSIRWSAACRPTVGEEGGVWRPAPNKMLAEVTKKRVLD